MAGYFICIFYRLRKIPETFNSHLVEKILPVDFVKSDVLNYNVTFKWLFKVKMNMIITLIIIIANNNSSINMINMLKVRYHIQISLLRLDHSGGQHGLLK